MGSRLPLIKTPSAIPSAPAKYRSISTAAPERARPRAGPAIFRRNTSRSTPTITRDARLCRRSALCPALHRSGNTIHGTMQGQSEHERQEAERDDPFPPRFRHLKRWVITAVLVTLALLVLRVWWGRQAQHRLDALVAEARASGESILIRDFVPPDVPEPLNAAIPLRAASAKLVETEQQKSWLFDQELPLTPLDQRIIRDIREQNKEALRLVRQARDRKHVDWGIRPATPMVSLLLPHLSPMRRLAFLIHSLILFEHVEGQDAAALEHVRDVMFQAR